MIKDFIEELKKKFESGGMEDWLQQSGNKEIYEFVHAIYNGIKGGEIRDCVKVAAFKFIKSIKPDITTIEAMKGVVVIESIVETVFCMMVKEGVLTKIESEGKDKIVMHWEKEDI